MKPEESLNNPVLLHIPLKVTLAQGLLSLYSKEVIKDRQHGTG